MTKISLIDYGIGNLLSVERAFRHIGGDFQVITTAAEIKAADKLILPGVGAFSSCTGELEKRGLSDAIREAVEKQKFLFGICVGMQMLFENSEEFGMHPGLGFLRGSVKPVPMMDIQAQKHKIPHIGWTSLIKPGSGRDWQGTLLQDTPVGTEVYFVHSFAADPVDAGDRLADIEYGGHRLSAMVARGNIFGTQFHPEKSGPAGLKILENFVKL